MCKRIFLSILIFLFSLPCWGAKYISPTGNNGNSGADCDNAYLTFSYAQSQISAGDTLYLCDGTYTTANSGMLLAAKSGTSGNYITFEAVNEGSVIIDCNGTCGDSAIDTKNYDYLRFIGLHAQEGYQQDAVIHIDGGSTNIIFQRTTAHDAMDGYNVHVWIVEGTNNLVEDCAGWGIGRNSLLLFGNTTNNNTIRRFWAQLGQHDGTGGGMTCIQVYEASNNILENIICTVADDFSSAHTQTNGINTWENEDEGEPGNNNWIYGSVVYDLDRVTARTGDSKNFGETGKVEMAYTNKRKNIVSIGNVYGLYFGGGSDSYWAENATVVGATQDGFVAEDIYELGNTETLTLINSIILNNTTCGYDEESFTPDTFTHTYNTFYGNGTNFCDDSQHGTENNTDPDFDTATYGYGAYLMRPDALKSLGSGGGDIGAEVLYRYEDGVLTSAPLWPWPMEARILSESGYSVTYEADSGIWKTLSGVPSYATVCSSGCDYTQATFEALSGDKSGITYYFSGTFTSTLEVNIYGTSGNPVVLDGYEAGDCDHIPTEDTNAALIDPNNKANGVFAIHVDKHDYITIQDFRIKRGGHGIYIDGNTSNYCVGITIQRVWVSDCYNIGIELGSTDGLTGVQYGTIQDSVIYDIGRSRGTSAIANINLDDCRDTVIKNNMIYNYTGAALVGNGADGIVTHTSNRLLVEGNTMYHFGEDCIDFKVDSTDLIFRYNHCYDTLADGLNIQSDGGNNAYVYGNYIGKEGETINYNCLKFARGFQDGFAWSNICYEPDHAGIVVIDVTSPQHPDHITVWNNTIIKSGQHTVQRDYYAGIAFWDALTSGSHEAYNNILVDNNIEFPEYIQLYMNSGISYNATVDYNLYYLSSGSPKVSWDGTERTLSDPMASNSFCVTDGQDCNGDVGNPLFTNYGSQDFTLLSGSPAIDTGTAITTGGILSGRNWDPPTIQGVDYSLTVKPDLVLDPNNTAWGGDLPVVVMLDQDNYGSGWEKGAYGWAETGGSGEGQGFVIFSGTGKFNYSASGTGKINR